MSGRTKPVQNVKSVNARRRETWKVRAWEEQKRTNHFFRNRTKRHSQG